MDGDRFDSLTKTIAGTSRRSLLKVGLGAVLSGAVGTFSRESVDAARRLRALGQICRKDGDCASGACGPRDGRGRGRCRCATAADCPQPEPGSLCRSAICDAGVCTMNDVCTARGTCAGTNAPVDCVVSDWSEWSPCSVPCGGGLKTHIRSVVTAASCGGAACPELSESQACNVQVCPAQSCAGLSGLAALVCYGAQDVYLTP